MQLEIVSPQAQLYSGEVKSLTLPGASGSFQILDNHAPIVSTLVAGRVKIEGNIVIEKENQSKFTKEGDYTFLEIESGAIELSKNKVILLTD